MAEVTLSVGGYHYKLACRDGEEAHLQRLGEMVNAKAVEARSAVGISLTDVQTIQCRLNGVRAMPLLRLRRYQNN